MLLLVWVVEISLQVLYGRDYEPCWRLPDRWYDFVVQDPAGFSVHFAVVDSQSLKFGINDPEAKLQWLDDTFASSTSEWRVIVLHHPPYATGFPGPVDTDVDEQVSQAQFIESWFRVITSNKTVLAEYYVRLCSVEEILISCAPIIH
jgi:hypothetical protein